jgi:SNF2 family DNA or RNA helicase
MNWQPHQYQISAAQHALYNAGSALFLEPGLGKTSISMAVVSTLREQNVIGGTLVIAPLRVCYSVWPNEAKKWSEFSHLSVGILHGKDKDKVLAQKHAIYVINPEGLQWLFAALNGAKVWPFDNLIIDESTKFKNTQSQRFKAVKAVLPRFKRVLALTGTPCANRLEDIFGQVYLLDGGQRLGKYITHFHREYFDEQRNVRLGFSDWFPRKDTAERIRAKVEDVCLYMKAEDHLTMPERIDNQIAVELPESVRDDYRKIEQNFFATIGGKAVSAAHAAAAQMKLRQMVGGQVYSEEGVATMHTVKLDALEDLVEEASGEPMLVAVNFQHEAAAIQKMLRAKFKIDAPYLGGGISPVKSDAIAADWNAGKLPVLLAHPSSVAHGLNLQAGGHTVVWYTLTWSLEEYDQLNRRVYRQGQSRGVVIHHIIAANTVDETVLAALQSKDVTQKGFLNALKRSQA